MELVVFVGLQASGKSTFYKTYLKDTHVLVSKDLMGSSGNRARRQIREISDALRDGKSIVVDNTNPTSESRKEIIALGKQFGAKIITYYFKTKFDECVRRNTLRDESCRIPLVGLKTIAKQLQPPTEDEGFDEIHVIAESEPEVKTLMKAYILVKESVAIGFAMVGVSHAGSALVVHFKDTTEGKAWLSGPFNKTICKVSDEEFEQAKQCEDHIIITESRLDGAEIALAFKPREEWPKAFKFFRLYK